MKGETEICAGDALIGYGKDLRGIGSELCCCGKELIGFGLGWLRSGDVVTGDGLDLSRVVSERL